MTKEELFSLKPKRINYEMYKEAKHLWDLKQKPLDGLGDFEETISKILAINEDISLKSLKKVLVIMCADHGVVEEGVSQTGQEVTLSVAKALGENISSASKMAAYAHVDVKAVDIGINSDEIIKGVRNLKIKHGTDNFTKTQAMTIDETILAIETGITIANECKINGYNIIATGEMGIGNTTSGTAMLCALTGVDVSEVIGRGAGLSDDGLIRKKQVIESALSKYNLVPKDVTGDYVLNVMNCVGGLELAAMTGLFIGGAVYGIPVMIDGVLSAVSALCAEKIMTGAKEFMIPSHSGREKGTKLALDNLELTPLINGNMALGEGTGALMTMPLIDMAFDFYKNALTFEAGNVKQYVRQDTK